MKPTRGSLIFCPAQWIGYYTLCRRLSQLFLVRWSSSYRTDEWIRHFTSTWADTPIEWVFAIAWCVWRHTELRFSRSMWFVGVVTSIQHAVLVLVLPFPLFPSISPFLPFRLFSPSDAHLSLGCRCWGSDCGSQRDTHASEGSGTLLRKLESQHSGYWKWNSFERQRQHTCSKLWRRARVAFWWF